MTDEVLSRREICRTLEELNDSTTELLTRFSRRHSKGGRTLQLIEAAWESIKKFDATYQKVSSLQNSRFQVPLPGSMEQEEDDENEEFEEVDTSQKLSIPLIETEHVEDGQDFGEEEDETSSSSGSSEYEDQDEVDASTIKQHKRYLQLVVQRTNEFLRAHKSGEIPF